MPLIMYQTVFSGHFDFLAYPICFMLVRAV
jgi:hypothetical protein